MIRPSIRASLTWQEIEQVAVDLDSLAPDLAQRFRSAALRGAIDEALTDLDVQSALLGATALPSLTVPLSLHLLVAVHQALNDVGVRDLDLSDYLATLLLAFGSVAKAAGVADNQAVETVYLTDLIAKLGDSPEATPLKAHVAELSLWLCGIWHEWIRSREATRGAPGLSYYESVGRAYFSDLSFISFGAHASMAPLYEKTAERFPVIRVALNEVADRHLFPASIRYSDRQTADALDVERLLRRTSELFEARGHA